eukprot:EG_transcript_11438
MVANTKHNLHTRFQYHPAPAPQDDLGILVDGLPLSLATTRRLSAFPPATASPIAAPRRLTCPVPDGGRFPSLSRGCRGRRSAGALCPSTHAEGLLYGHPLHLSGADVAVLVVSHTFLSPLSTAKALPTLSLTAAFFSAQSAHTASAKCLFSSRPPPSPLHPPPPYVTSAGSKLSLRARLRPRSQPLSSSLHL